jgi:hypothetical protein
MYVYVSFLCTSVLTLSSFSHISLLVLLPNFVLVLYRSSTEHYILLLLHFVLFHFNILYFLTYFITFIYLILYISVLNSFQTPCFTDYNIYLYLMVRIFNFFTRVLQCFFYLLVCHLDV